MMDLNSSDLNTVFRGYLQNEFSRRLRTNSRYSLRAFANHMQIDSSSLSKFLSGKRKLSQNKIEKLGIKVGFKYSPDNNTLNFNLIEQDRFAMISDWIHYAILDLTQLNNFKYDISWIAKKLSISPIETEHAIQRMLRLGFLVKENNKLKKSSPFFTNFTEGETSEALKEYQQQIISKALASVYKVDQEKKDITSITIAANSSKLDEARKKIKTFRRDLCQFLEDGNNKDAVYHLALQLYPVTNFD